MEETKRNFNGKMLAVILCLVFLCAAGIVVYLRTLPVDYDAGACSGGYETFIFDKYNEELVELYCNDLEDGSAISSAKAIKGTEQADWEKRTIYMNGMFLREKLFDYVDIVVAPLLVGGKATTTLIDGDAIFTPVQPPELGVLKLEYVQPLKDSYVRLRYKVLS